MPRPGKTCHVCPGPCRGPPGAPLRNTEPVSSCERAFRALGTKAPGQHPPLTGFQQQPPGLLLSASLSSTCPLLCPKAVPAHRMRVIPVSPRCHQPPAFLPGVRGPTCLLTVGLQGHLCTGLSSVASVTKLKEHLGVLKAMSPGAQDTRQGFYGLSLARETILGHRVSLSLRWAALNSQVP